MQEKKYDSDLVETGKRIREKREALGMSQEQFAELLGVSKNTVHRYETGGVEMGLKAFFRLSEITGALPNELSPTRLTEIENKKDETNEIIHIIKGLNSKLKKIVFPVIRELIDSLTKNY